MTLVHDGLNEGDTQKRYRPTELVWSLVLGFQNRDQLVSIARPLRSEFTSQHLWPLAISGWVGNRMMINQSTTILTTQTLAYYYPDYTLPLLECAAGKAYLAFRSPKEFGVVQKSIEHFPEENAGWGAKLANSDFSLRKCAASGSRHMRAICTTIRPE